MSKRTKKYKFLIKTTSILVLNLSLMLGFCLPNFSNEPFTSEVVQRVETQPSDIPIFNAPVCLLVGLNSTELNYREISSLAGFELFSVPYRADIKTLAEQIKPTQIIIKHPSGFVGLYSTDGQLIRGIQTVNQDKFASGQGTPPSIIQPTEANPMYENLFYPGSVTGSVPHGGLGYTPPPKGRNNARHLLKLGALLGLRPFQYPGYFMAYNTYSNEKLFPALLLPQVPAVIGAVSSYADAKLDQGEYESARAQPRDYMFQPVIEGY